MTHYSHVLLNLSYGAVRGRERKILTLSRSSSALPSRSLKVPNDEKRLGWPKLIHKNYTAATLSIIMIGS